MSHVPRTKLVSLGVDPDTKTSGIALMSCELPIGLTQEPIDVRVEGVACTSVIGMDARFRLPEMTRHLCQEIEKLMGGRNIHAIVVEGMAHRKNDPRPDNIVQLAVVQGIAAGAALALASPPRYGDVRLLMPLPVVWAGTIGKAMRQKILLKELGLTPKLRDVPGAPLLEPREIGHVIDGIGLALWGLKQLVFEEKRMRILR